MQRILIAADGSAHAKKALTFAADLANKYDAELVILHVAQISTPTVQEMNMLELEYPAELHPQQFMPAASSIRGGGQEGTTQMPAQQVETSALARRLIGERLLSDAEDLARAGGAQRIRTLLTTGDPATEILSVAEDRKADAIAVGSRGLGGLKGLLLGSVSHKLAHLAKCTLIIVR